MLNAIIVFFLLSAGAFLLGFGGAVGAFAAVAQFLAGVFVVLLVVSIAYKLLTERMPGLPF